ncbi:MAG: hypothetical protein NZ869_00880 [Thermoanaerobaculum sp.]|nr:hypothetical protein [Thermoanaerobaculum sp.]MDW7966858.1 hypothetical protein [Thermoanaerobaculum sp.]
MSYPGSPDKDPRVQQRILAAFREAVRLYQDGHREECQTVLHSILEVDPAFRPAQRLESALIQGLPVDLASLLGDVAGQTPTQTDQWVGQARQALGQRNFSRAAELAQAVLRELPGHQEARAILQQAQAALKGDTEVRTQLARARQALAAGLVHEAKGFLALVRQLDPNHPELAELEAQLASQTPSEGFSVEIETFQVPHATVPAKGGGGAQGGRGETSWGGDWQVPAGELAFESVPEAPAFGGGEEVQSSGGEDRVAMLLAEGQEAFDRGDYTAAVDVWSRIYLIDPHNQEAERRIEQARRRREELDRQAEMKFAEAMEAFEAEQYERARELLHEVLALQPQHVDANDLLARLETPQAPPPLPADLPVVEEDLFRDDFVPREIASGESMAIPAPEVEVRPTPRPRARAAAPRWSLPIPLPVLLGVGLALVVLVVLGFTLGGKVFQSGPSLEDTLQEAERLAQQGQLQDAIKLLQTLNLEGSEANEVQQRILEYQRKLKVQTRPAPSVDLTPAREALASGRYFKALRLLREAAKQLPQDEQLRQTMAQVTAYDASLPALADAWERGNWEGAVRLLTNMVEAHPQDGELQQAWQVARYNWALVLLRGFEVAEAARVLEGLAKDSNDPEVGRLHELARSYLSRSVDPRYKIFVNNLNFRELP